MTSTCGFPPDIYHLDLRFDDLDRCVVEGAHCSWLDAAFTSTSAVCVTGLVVENTATFFSPTGQWVILLLIQIGGLGIMTLTFFAAVVLFEGLSLHDRLLLGKMIQENRLSRIGRTLTFIVLMTFVIETAGALVLFHGMDAGVGFRERVFQSVFHSVSAFCNAGFSTLPDGTMKFCIIGLGTFGTQLARQLSREGHEIVAVDNNPAHVSQLKDEIEYLIQADCTDLNAFHEIPITIAKGRGTLSSASTQHPLQKVLGVPAPGRCFEPDDILVLFGKAHDIRKMIRELV